MPLPRLSEQAAARVESILATLDRRLVRYLAQGGTAPRADPIMDEIERQIRRAVSAGMLEVDPLVTDNDIAREVRIIAAPIRTAVEQAIGRTVNLRARVDARTPRRRRPDELLSDYALEIGATTVLAMFLRQRRLTRQQQTRMARELGIRLPRPLGAYGRMVVRTETANARNNRAADVVDARNVPRGTSIGPDTSGAAPVWAIYVEDARLGPTDEPCEDVNRKWATSAWMRENLTEHPNCTRRGLPRQLPAGARITLTV